MIFRLTFLLLLLCAAATTALAQPDRKLLARADSLMRVGKTAEALAIVDRQVERNRQNPLLLRMRGGMYLSMGNLAKAKADFQSSLAIDPESAETYLALAAIDFREENPRLALARLNSAVDLDKQNTRAWYMRAEARRALGDHTAAVSDYDNAIRLEPGNSELLASRALNDVLRGNFSEALTFINRAMEVSPNMAALHGLRARIYASMQKMPEALADLTRSIELGSTGAEVYITRGAIFDRLGRNVEAVADYDRALALDSTSIDALYNRSLARYAMDDIDGSCDDTRRALELATIAGSDPKFIEELRLHQLDHCDSSVMSYFYQRGIASYNLNDFVGAIAHYEEGLKRYPGSPMLIMFRGNAHLAKGDPASALTDYEYVIENIDAGIEQMATNIRVPGRTSDEKARLKANVLATLYGSMADAHSKRGDISSAIASFDRALAVSEGSQAAVRITLLNSRGILKMLSGNNEGALADFDSIGAIDPKVSGVHTARAIALFNSAQNTPITVSLFNRGERPEGTMGEKILFPIAAPTIFSRDKADAALQAAERAVETGADADQAWLVRGYLRSVLGRSGGCDDIRKAKELGSTDADAVLAVICR